MNYKSIILIALALCMCIAAPVAAVWQNGNWIMNGEAPDVVYDPVTGVSSKYVDTNPAIALANDGYSYVGHVTGNLKSGQVSEGGTRFLISNDLTPDITTPFFFKPDGMFDDYFAEGNFTATLPQGTGSAAGTYSDDAGYIGNLHPEVAHFRVVAGQESYFTFIGNSIANRGVPAAASIDAYFGCGDINLKWWKIVKTGQHPYTVPAWDEYLYKYIVNEEQEAWTEYFGDYRRSYGGYYEFVGTNQADYDVTFVQHTGHGNYDKVGDHYVRHTGGGHGNYDVSTYSEVGHVHHPYIPEVISGWVHHVPMGKIVVDADVIHHPEYIIQIPEFGIEFFIEIAGAHVDVSNPNIEPVNVDFKFDINYFIDTRPWDHRVDDGRIVPQSTTYSGSITRVDSGVTTYHGTLHPDIDNAVMVADWNHFGLQYVPTITNDVVTRTVWA